MTDIQEKYEQYLKNQVGHPYVWSAAGEIITEKTYEKYIDSHEKNPENALRAKNFCKKLFESGKKRLRPHDCSGLISKALMYCGLRTWRCNCDILWDKCEPTDTVKDYTLLFRVSKNNPSDETHVGTYFNGKQYHAKGRDVGIVAEPFDPSYWDKFGNYKGLNTTLSDYVFTKTLKSPMYSSNDVKELKKLLKANGFGMNLGTNGNYLSKTKQAVLDFQKHYFKDESEWDGIAGKKTITALNGIWEGK